MREEERMTNRELAHLCAKGIVEWRREKDDTVRHAYEYKNGLDSQPADGSILIRPFERSDAEWFPLSKTIMDRRLTTIQGEVTPYRTQHKV